MPTFPIPYAVLWAAPSRCRGAVPGNRDGADCCIVKDPTGTPLNVRDKPNGSILFTVHNKDVVGGPDKLKKDDRGRVWAFIKYPFSDVPNGVREGWVFLKYLDCEASAIEQLRKDMKE